MAEIAAGAYVAAEVVEHTAEAGYAAYIVSKPTLPLKVTFTRIATATGDTSAYVLYYCCSQNPADFQTLVGTLQSYSHSDR
jgi:hypothetical protein